MLIKIRYDQNGNILRWRKRSFDSRYQVATLKDEYLEFFINNKGSFKHKNGNVELKENLTISSENQFIIKVVNDKIKFAQREVLYDNENWITMKKIEDYKDLKKLMSFKNGKVHMNIEALSRLEDYDERIIWTA